MKKIVLLAVALILSATMTNALADKKKKKKAQEPAQQTVVLQTASDSLSYTAGLSATQGLVEYLQRQLHVDTAYISDFVRGFRDAQTKMSDPAFLAYNAGVSIAQQAESQIFPGMGRDLKDTPDSLTAAMFNEGFIAGVVDDTTHFTKEKASKYFRTRNTEIRKKREVAYKAENEKWLSDNATKEGVKVLPSGLQYKVLKQGNGPVPKKEETVNVVYEGKTIDGNVFDATVNHGKKKYDTFRCNQVIKGWTEALTMMPVGSKWEIYIPQNLAYGGRQAGKIKPYSTLIFTVELQGIEPPKTPKKADSNKAEAQKKDAASKASAGKSSNTNSRSAGTSKSKTSR